MTDPLEDIAYVARSPNRAAVLSALEEGPATRRELGERTGASRATLARILGDLEERRWIERSGDHYLATPLGSLVAEEFSNLVDTMDAVGTIRDVAHLLPTDDGLGLRAFADAAITTPEPDDPTAHLDLAYEHVATADGVAILATTALPRIARVAAERLRDGGFSFTATIPAAFARDLSPDSDVLVSFREIVASGGSVRLVEEPIQYNLAVADDAVVLWLCDDEGTDQGVLVTEDGRVREWAHRRIDRHDDAVPLQEARVTPSEG